MIKKIFMFMFVFVLMSSVAYSVSFNDTILYYNFNDDSINGTTLIDQTGNSNGTINGLTTGDSGILGEAFTSDGTNQFISYSDTSTNQFTMSFWLNGSTDVDMWSIDDESTQRSSTVRGAICIVWVGTTQYTVVPTVDYTDNSWHHVICSYDGETLKLYVDGVLDVENTAPSGNADTYSGVWHIFKRRAGSTTSFTGSIDELGYWDRALNDSGCSVSSSCGGEISSLYNSGFGISYPFLSSGNITINLLNFWDNAIINTTNISANFSFANGTEYTFNGNPSTSTIQTNLSSTITDLANITLYETNCIGSCTYFNQFKPNVNLNVSNFLNYLLIQSDIKFNITDTFGNAVSGNLTINGTTQTNDTSFYLTAQDYNVTFSAQGYYNETQQFSISSLQNQTLTIANVSKSRLNITAVQTNGSSINEFNITVNGTEYQTTNGTILVNVMSGNNYFVIMNSSSYAIANATIPTVVGMTNYTFTLYTTNSINFSLINEVTEQLITGVNFTFVIVGNINSYNYTTNTGSLYVDLLTPDDYEIRYYSTDNNDFPLRSYFTTITQQSFQDITLYTLNESQVDITTAQITFNVFDQNIEPVEDAQIRVSRFYVSANGYVDVFQRYTNLNGEAVGTFEAIDAFYKYDVYYQGELKESSSVIGTQFVDDSVITIYINTESTYSGLLNELAGITTNLNYTNQTNSTGYVSFEYSASEAYQVCLTVNELSSSINPSSAFSSNTCQTSSGGTIITNINSSGLEKTYSAVATIILSDGTEVFSDSLIFTVGLSSLSSSAEWKDMSLFIALIILLLGATMALRFPEVSLGIQGVLFTLLALPPLKIIPISLVFVGWFIALIIVILIILNKNRQ